MSRIRVNTPGGPAGGNSLQQAYDVDTTVPQIGVASNAPFTIRGFGSNANVDQIQFSDATQAFLLEELGASDAGDQQGRRVWTTGIREVAGALVATGTEAAFDFAGLHRGVYELNPTAAGLTIQGFDLGAFDGQEFVLIHAGSSGDTITLNHRDVAAAAASRIVLPWVDVSNLATPFDTLTLVRPGEWVKVRQIASRYWVIETGLVTHAGKLTRENVTGQSVASGSPVAVNFDAEPYDVGGIADPAGGAGGDGEIVIPRPGLYEMTAAAACTLIDAGEFFQVEVNIDATKEAQNRNHGGGANNVVYAEVNERRYLDAGAVVTLDVQHNEGAPATLRANNFDWPRLEVVEVLPGG